VTDPKIIEQLDQVNVLSPWWVYRMPDPLRFKLLFELPAGTKLESITSRSDLEELAALMRRSGKSCQKVNAASADLDWVVEITNREVGHFEVFCDNNNGFRQRYVFSQ
jgi:hypothetical protein